MKYSLVIISRIETDSKHPIVALTFYPTGSACIRPREYETIAATYVQHLEPAIELADVVSDKGRHRLKILLRGLNFTEDERRSKGTTYYSLMFGHTPGNNEEKKGAADALYYTLCDLYKADASSEEAWAAACEAALSGIRRLAARCFA